MFDLRLKQKTNVLQYCTCKGAKRSNLELWSTHNLVHVLLEEKRRFTIQGCRIPGSGDARAPPVFRTLSHKNAIKPKNLHFSGVWAPPDCSWHPQFSGGCDTPATHSMYKIQLILSCKLIVDERFSFDTLFTAQLSQLYST